MSSALWSQCLSHLEKTYNESEVTAWLRTISAEENGTSLVLQAPNRFTKRKIESDYLEKINEITEFLTGVNYEIRVDIPAGKSPAPNTFNRSVELNGNRRATVTHLNDKQPFGFESLNSEYTFDQHVVGESNQLARYMAQGAAEQPGLRDHNPLFLYGDVGNGKTHLMQAAGHEIIRRFPEKQVRYVRANNFVRHLVTLMKRKDNENIEHFKNFYHDLDVLLIDDIHHFAGADVSQQEFLHTFNALLEGNKQIIITSDRFFKELQGVENRLRSRLGQGITIRVRPPELETRIAILESKAERRGIKLEPDVSAFVAEKINSSVRELEGVLNQLIAFHRFTNNQITIPMVKSVLFEMLEFHARPVDITTIVREVARFYRIRTDDIHSNSRKAGITRARHVAMVLARELTTLSLPRIASEIGGKNHTTVVHATKKVSKLLETDAGFKNDFNTLKDILST